LPYADAGFEARGTRVDRKAYRGMDAALRTARDGVFCVFPSDPCSLTLTLALAKNVAFVRGILHEERGRS